MKDNDYDIPVELIDKYPLFEPNQVLTSSHLNQMRNYLYQQDQLTRARLIGTGIQYGFEIIRTSSSIEITSGAGITTEGYLIRIDPTDDRIFTKFRRYSGNGIAYNPFQIDDQTSIELWELLPDNAIGDDIKLIENSGSDLEKMIVVLYLEIKPYDYKTCFSTNCDDKGGEMQFKLRKLLVHEAEVSRLFSTEIPVEIPQQGKLPRIKLRALEIDSISSKVIYMAYNKVCSDESIMKVVSALKESYDHFEIFLQHQYNGRNPFNNLESTLIKWRDDPNGEIQYFHDFLIDLLQAYEEFKKIAARLSYKTFTIDNDYPRHLLLGKLTDIGLIHQREFRHQFEPTSDYLERKETKEKLVWYHRRLTLLVANFRSGRGKGLIAITPSRENGDFGDRSIPFYYVPNLGDQPLYQNWSYQAYLQQDSDEILSYNNNYSISDIVLKPLAYHHSASEFLRIEGHLGKTKKEAREAINLIRQESRLPFDLVVLSRSENEKDTSPEEDAQTAIALGYNDLQEDYYFHRLRLIHFVEDMKSLVSTLLESNKEDLENGYRDVTDGLDIFDRYQLITTRIDDLIKLLPPNLLNFNYSAFKDAYKQSLQDTIDFALIENNLLEEFYYELHYVQESDGVSFGNNVVNQLVKLLFRIFDRLFYTRLLHTYTAFKARIPVSVTTARVSKNKTKVDQSVFIDQHPGLVHLGGVYKGGTFVLVCDQNEKGVSEVVADFSLPYLCCGGGGGSGSSGGGLAFSESSIKNIRIAPFARPDYAIIKQGGKAEINVLDNDYRLFEADLKLSLINNTTANGGKVKIVEKGANEPPILIYKQTTDFLGIDKLYYKMTNRISGLSDEGEVTIYVRQFLLHANDNVVATAEGVPIVIDVLENDDFDKEKPIIVNFRRGSYNSWQDDNGNRIEERTTSLGTTVQLITPIEGNSFFRYMANIVGEDEFQYRIYQDNAKSMARVKITVKRTQEMEIALEKASRGPGPTNKESGI